MALTLIYFVGVVLVIALACFYLEFRIRGALRTQREENAEFEEFLDEWREDASWTIGEMARLKDEMGAQIYGPTKH